MDYTQQVKLLVDFKVKTDGLEQVTNIDADFDKDIEHVAYSHVRDRYQATMSIVDDEVAVKFLGG